MPDFTIVLGNKAYSSWSLRGWLPLKLCGADFDEVIVPLRQSDSRERLLEASPAGKVPVLKTDKGTVSDSLAIAEYLAERFPAAGLWPDDPWARAMARSVTAEMHSSFPNLRNECPMDVRSRHEGRQLSDATRKDIERITEIWRDCRDNFGSGGDFLFGSFGIADAFFAPVVSRFVTYDVDLDPVCSAYRDAVMTRPEMREWIEAGLAEPWIIEFGN
ncbi:glutathione S-transferase family protein [Denitrobaculum tricleocarpae]|uniref:Glutathione S-transferase family protein n=1 Tax=Denitrobaculum tricleocarpae TaxID=2591009 RepID=A0A545U1A3_9PROT|nr:glutathione S-transferase family protein [Denitrobaculum tricleocarpae]TQV83245.1 glutathione S-transferase family protein [Denitrobaculum tricleocarpae]